MGTTNFQVRRSTVWTTTCSPGPSRTLRLLTYSGSSPMNGRYHYKVCEDALLISRDRYHWHTYHILFCCCMQRRMRLRCDGLCPCYNDFQISQRPTPFRAATIVLLNCFLAALHRRCLVTRYSTLPPSTSSISCPFNQTNTVSSESAIVSVPQVLCCSHPP